jgi:hypothetical protein
VRNADIGVRNVEAGEGAETEGGMRPGRGLAKSRKASEMGLSNAESRVEELKSGYVVEELKPGKQMSQPGKERSRGRRMKGEGTETGKECGHRGRDVKRG